MKNNFDLTVIGAGIIGVCTAWYARRRYTHWNIAIFDQDRIGSGASFYSASLDLPYGHTPTRFRLAEKSRFRYDELRREIPGLPIKDLPFYGIVQNENAPVVLEQLVDKNAKLCPDIIPSLFNKYPFFILPENATVISGGMVSQAIKNEVANALAKNFEVTPGSSIIERTKILSVTSKANTFDLQTADGKLFHSKRVVQATGPWMTTGLGESLVTSTKPRIKKIVAFHIYEQPKADDYLFYFFDDDAFLMPKFEAGYWLFSFKCDHWDVLPDVTALSIDKSDIQKAQSILKKYFPQFALHCTDGRVFCDAYTPDGDPIIEQAGDNANYVIAGAGAGSGYRLAPAIAEESVDLLG